MTLATPTYNLEQYPEVYDPSEDTFLLLDALEAEIPFLLQLKPTVAAEVGSGSGIVITALASVLYNSCLYFSTDINSQACLATKNTATLNNASIECLNMDLLTCFKPNVFDIILFNPPYVVTEPEEISGRGLSRAWAGGTCGREVIDKLLYNLPNLLTDRGVCYTVLLKENKPDEITHIMKQFKLDSDVILQRRVPGEQLYVYKFSRRLK